MREILFRGKPLGNLHGKFIYGSYRNFERVYDDEIEVIGNIYDTPRIIGGRK